MDTTFLMSLLTWTGIFYRQYRRKRASADGLFGPDGEAGRFCISGQVECCLSSGNAVRGEAGL